MSCPASYSNCPVSLGGGCCKNGMACGSGICYDTPKTLPVSETKTTTDSRGHATITVVTSMAVITEGLDPTSGSAAPSKITQLIPSTVAKMDSIQTNESGGGHGGLSSGALGGIVAGVIVILVVIVVAATFIVLRLKKAEKAAKLAEAVAESKRGSSNSPPRSHKAGFGQPSVSEITTATDVDPVNQFPIMRPSPDSRSRSATVVTGERSPSHTPNFTNSGASSPPIWGMPFNYVPSEGSDGRQSSLDSYPHHDNSNSNSRMSQRVSVDSYGLHGHSRQTSDTSELEEQHGVSELDTAEKNEAESRRRSNSATRPVKGHVRRNSDLSVQSRSRGDSNAATGALGTVSEIYELHGHYGPLHTASGQTAARLGRGPSSVSEASSHQDT
ncbi:hypothetical protein HD806DRAFT_79379 [Xylariaceae sp. AK1471]|nr:hypothetical protein HD806DRAFT_79379 [Xylariaceae sp. AK1471]